MNIVRKERIKTTDKVIAAKTERNQITGVRSDATSQSVERLIQMITILNDVEDREK